MNKKKILVYGFTYNIGGLESFYMNYYRKLNHEKYQVDFVKSYDKIAFEEELIKNGSKMHRIPQYRKNPIKFYKELEKLFKKENYDVFHVNMLSAVNIVHLKVAKKCGVKKIIAHSHNGDVMEQKNYKNRVKMIIHKINKFFISKYANIFVACSKLAGEYMFGRKKVKNNKIVILNNAIDLEKYTYNETKRMQIRNDLEIAQDTLVIGHIGRFNYQKNHKFIIDVLSKICEENKNVKLILIGKGNLEDEIKLYIRKQCLEENVLFLGQRKDVNEFYNVFDVFILPSLFEGLPVVGIEAQTNGLPCVFSNTITDEAKINENVFECGIKKEDIELWKNLILNIDTQRARNLKNLYNKYDINVEIESLKKLYD